MAQHYEVVHMDEYDEISPGGRFEHTQRITARTIPHGDEFTITIPVSRFSIAVAQATLEERAKELIAVREL